MMSRTALRLRPPVRLSTRTSSKESEPSDTHRYDFLPPRPGRARTLQPAKMEEIAMKRATVLSAGRGVWLAQSAFCTEFLRLKPSQPTQPSTSTAAPQTRPDAKYPNPFGSG